MDFKKYMNKRNIIILAILSLIIFISIDVYGRYKKLYDSLFVEFKDLNIEYGSDVDLYDLVDRYNGQLLIEGEVDSKSIGEYEINCRLSQREDLYRFMVNKNINKMVKVVDSKSPIIEIDKDEVYVYVGSDYNPKDNITRVYDEIDGDIDYEITGDIDLSKAGEYEVVVKAKDRNGLESNKAFKVIVRNRMLSAGEGYNFIYSYLTGTYGYNKAAACGILANIRFESNFNPDVGDYYYGLCQWGGSRRDNLYTYCANNGLDAASIEGQLSFMEYELSNYYGSVKSYLLNIDNTSEGAFNAGDYFCKVYEGAASAAGRGELASEYFNS